LAAYVPRSENILTVSGNFLPGGAGRVCGPQCESVGRGVCQGLDRCPGYRHTPTTDHCGDLAHKVTVRYNFVELELVQFRTFGKGSSRSTAAKPIER
jgi:hypothetical protein